VTRIQTFDWMGVVAEATNIFGEINPGQTSAVGCETRRVAAC